MVNFLRKKGKLKHKQFSLVVSLSKISFLFLFLTHHIEKRGKQNKTSIENTFIIGLRLAVMSSIQGQVTLFGLFCSIVLSKVKTTNCKAGTFFGLVIRCSEHRNHAKKYTGRV